MNNVINITVNRSTIPIQQSPLLIRVREVSLVYASQQRTVEVLHRINLDLGEQDFVCVIGPSGCGKTSLLQILAGYLSPTDGYVTVAGQFHQKPNADVGVVFQQPNLFPWLTVAQNIEFGPKMRGVPKADRREIVRYYLQLVGLSQCARLLPYQLSGGMKQRVAIARALAANPRIILMDEPFASLDAMTRETMQIHLKDIWQQTQKSIFFITHDVEEALLLSTRILLMHPQPGRLVQEIANPFARALGPRTAAQLRTSQEFVEMREYLMNKLREGIGQYE